MKKTKVLLIAVSVSIIIMFILLALIINKTNLLTNNGLINLNPESEQELFSFVVYDNQDNIKVLATINSSNGIDYIERASNGSKIYANGKNKISVDYTIKKDEAETIRIKEIGKPEIEETILVNDEFINNNVLKMEKIYEVYGYKTIEIKKIFGMEDTKIYYQIGEGQPWKEGDTTVSILDYDVKNNGLMNSDDTITITAKIENTANGNKVVVSKKYDIDPNSTLSSFEADSLLDGVERFANAPGITKITANGVQYNLSVRYYPESLTINTDVTLGSAEDVSNGSEYAKNMIVLKVDGDLTIEEGKTLTVYSSTYGGPKGLLIYCTGTLTNNGTISMSSKGAYAVGENVYLWKNADNTYEFVPAVGAAGGANAPKYVYNPGADGKKRSTGGGGAGGCGGDGGGPTGAGAAGTSYSGGSGGQGGGRWRKCVTIWRTRW